MAVARHIAQPIAFRQCAGEPVDGRKVLEIAGHQGGRPTGRADLIIEFFETADMMDTKVGASDSKDDPADVAKDGFEALMAGKERVVSHSLSTKAQGRASRFMPDRVKAKMHRGMAEPGSADDDED